MHRPCTAQLFMRGKTKQFRQLCPKIEHDGLSNHGTDQMAMEIIRIAQSHCICATKSIQ